MFYKPKGVLPHLKKTNLVLDVSYYSITNLDTCSSEFIFFFEQRETTLPVIIKDFKLTGTTP